MSGSFDFGWLADPIHHQTEEQARWTAAITQSAEQMHDGDQVLLRDVTTFLWDRVCIFGGGASDTFINDTLGFIWLTQPDFVEEDRQLWVFVQNDHVHQHLIFSPPLVGSRAVQDQRMGICLQPEDAVFTLESFSTSTYRRVFWMMS